MGVYSVPTANDCPEPAVLGYRVTLLPEACPDGTPHAWTGPDLHAGREGAATCRRCGVGFMACVTPVIPT